MATPSACSIRGRVFTSTTGIRRCSPWLIGIGNQIVPGPALAFLGTLLLYAGGYVLVATYFLRTGRPLAAQIAVLLLFFPIAVHELREVGKDTALAALCLFWFGVFLHRAMHRRAFSVIETLALAAVMVLLIDTRANSIFAALPLLLLATWHVNARRWVWPRRVAGALLLLALASGAGQAFDRLVLDAYDMHPIVSLETFDIGGTTYFSGRDQSRGLLGPDFLQRNKSCYTRQAWDSYVWGACPEIGKRALADPPGKMFRAWLGAIANAPLAYMKHRLLHFLTFTRVLCQGVCDAPITSIFWQEMAPPQFQRKPSPLALTIDKIGTGIETSLVGRPWIWLVELLCCAGICARRLRGGRGRIDAVFGLCLAASGLLYGLGYLAVGVASVLRYGFWIFVSGTLAPLFAWQAVAAPPEDR